MYLYNNTQVTCNRGTSSVDLTMHIIKRIQQLRGGGGIVTPNEPPSIGLMNTFTALSFLTLGKRCQLADTPCSHCTGVWEAVTRCSLYKTRAGIIIALPSKKSEKPALDNTTVQLLLGTYLS